MPRLCSPQTLTPELQLLQGKLEAFPGQPRAIVYFLGRPLASSLWDVTGALLKGGVQGASGTNTASADSSQCRGAAALFRAPPGWQSSPPYLVPSHPAAYIWDLVSFVMT
ncbi:hypothetical protein ILYODFUR_038675 [Ilyodon furcidens]|uniref:Uncharacterized protein n=1 Tax=Ilyodon furcidens TaxID=33524 RepID=A0ABV0U2J2_9TELE